MNCELLAPAGSYEIGLKALYSGADALYLGLNKFGARAYAKNFTFEELSQIVNIANVLNKKIYVTVNTLIKDNELNDVYETLNEISKIGVHGVITTDYAVINYVINSLPNLECHISTQVGVKCLEDVNYFTNLKAKRTVLAREVSIKEIKRIKENSKMPIEVFIHGALCVSYSGNCFFSSLLTLRSGNRGRCAQNCRREYTLLKDDKLASDKGFLLSTKDLNSFDLIPTLQKLGVDSLKIEGRMKDINYVKTLVYTYRNKLDDSNYKTDLLDKVFHREYTSGFLNDVDNDSLVNRYRSSNVGEYLGEFYLNKDNYYVFNLKTNLKINDRIRIIADKEYYFDVTNIYDKNYKEIKEANNIAYLKLNIKVNNGKAYIIKNRNLADFDINKIPLDIYFNTNNNDVIITASFNNNYYTYEEKNILTLAKTKGLTKDDLIKQFKKLNDTPFYLANFTVVENVNNYFLAVSQINNLRRNIIDTIYNSYKLDNRVLPFTLPKLSKKDIKQSIIVTVSNEKQAKILADQDVKIYYKDNYLSYNEYNNLKDDDILISNYGSITLNPNKNLTLNKEFNVFNFHSLAYFLNIATNVTLSQELSFKEIKNLITNFINYYGFKPNVDFIIYGHMTLMTLKYCVIKNLSYCPQCKEHQFALKDDTSTFPLLTDNKCHTKVLNGKATNLIEEIKDLKPYINRFRLDFTIETPEECLKLVQAAKLALADKTTHTFNSKLDTRAYFNREIL